MNVMFISMCEKNALSETRRILDTFASRNGDKGWRTSITLNGLETTRKLLRASARKNTAVGCYRIGSGSGFELLWTIGGKGRFAQDGSTPTNTTSRDILRTKDERQLKGQRWTGLLVDLSGLFHDLGKAVVAFQAKLRHSVADQVQERNQYRHEWISLRLFAAFVNGRPDTEWLKELTDLGQQHPQHMRQAWLARYKPLIKPSDDMTDAHKHPFKGMGDLARAVGWLIVSHHRIPGAPYKERQSYGFSSLPNWHHLIDVDWNEHVKERSEDVSAYWTLQGKLPFVEPVWCKRVVRVAVGMTKELQRSDAPKRLCEDPYVMHMARLCLMWADHHYSSLSTSNPAARKAKPAGKSVSSSPPDPRRICVKTESEVFANTQNGDLNQPLVEHLVGVAMKGAEIARALPDLNRILPGLGYVKALKKRSGAGRFEWQDKAVDAASKLAKSSRVRGAFVVNMASTGVGKTIANARIIDALSIDNPAGMRAVFALGLRTLTLQTGKEFRSSFGLNEEQVAIRVGGNASQTMTAWYEEQAEVQGSASSAPLDEEEGFVDADTDIVDHRTFTDLLSEQKIRGLVAAPILVCTVDHLVPATDSLRGGKQIAPMLRLMTSDLVLDEPDDFDIADLPALARLVNWAGLWGARVILSSATLTPDLVAGLFDAYRAGRHHFDAQHDHADSGVDLSEPGINCLWVDEFGSRTELCGSIEVFTKAHNGIAAARHQQLSSMTNLRRRTCELAPIGFKSDDADERPLIDRVAKDMVHAAFTLHGQNAHLVDQKKGAKTKTVSFGLIRLANINRIQKLAPVLAQSDWPPGVQVHLCVYHSKFPTIIRSGIEEKLDRILKQKDKDKGPLQQAEVLGAMANYPDAKHHMFIVLGSPVTEVGRDHDYDWGILEPSSMRSLIQIVGRIRRHRPDPYHATNVIIMRKNFNALDGKAVCFQRPGFELEKTKEFIMTSQDLKDLMDPSILQCLDSRPRLLVPAPVKGNEFSRLEHRRIAHIFKPHFIQEKRGRHDPRSPLHVPGINATTWGSQPCDAATFTTTVVKAWPFRKDNSKESDLLLHVDDEGEIEIKALQEYDGSSLMKINTSSRFGAKKITLPTSLKGQQNDVPDEWTQGSQLAQWFDLNYVDLITQIADDRGMDIDKAVMLFGQVRVAEVKPTDRLYFSSALGVGKRD